MIGQLVMEQNEQQSFGGDPIFAHALWCVRDDEHTGGFIAVCTCTWESRPRKSSKIAVSTHALHAAEARGGAA